MLSNISKEMSILHAKQEQMSVPDHQMIMDVSTRWNSTLYMIDRLLEQQWPVSTKCHKCQNLSEIQWEILSTVKSLLELFEAATVFISGDKYVTASAVVSVIHALHAKMEPAPDNVAHMKQLKDTTSRQLIQRWPLELHHVTGDNKKLFSVVLKSAALDLCFKFNCLSPETAQYVRLELATEAIQYVTRTKVVDLQVDTDNDSVVVLGLEMSSRTNFESLALKVKSLALRVKSLALSKSPWPCRTCDLSD